MFCVLICYRSRWCCREGIVFRLGKMKVVGREFRVFGESVSGGGGKCGRFL